MKRLITFTLLTFLSTTPAYAAEKQEMKCYVKDSSGIDGVYLINAYLERIPYLKADLVGRTFSKGLYKNRKVETVIECVKETELFNNVVARQLDRETLR
ncbi:hypothetical protein tloyanaT_19700 [Thalassotalea loyana]|uniref:DUF3316 domain-containing protein n=1 Tax=Thalassotalea loyana TaxID=280483 RepID=A0ABQ6HC88_9GAMM|nr:TapY2 family type IVa secretion system protein [Thalassotalea loyana]GLX85718.1 hypothetical protein tloyanaT_19700 [Thalassotalea loyana]